MKHTKSLTIGCTGMLKDATHYLAKHSEYIAIVARTASAFNHQSFCAHTTLINADYSFPNFCSAIDKEFSLSNVNCILMWIHESGLFSLESLLKIFSKKKCTVIHILGSSNTKPNENILRVQKKYNLRPNCQYLTVTLGSIINNGKRRWLTHDEISSGVIQAIKTGISQQVGSKTADTQSFLI